MLPKLGGIILIAITLLMTLSGCWDKHELGDLALILGIGIDRGDDGSLQMTAELAYQKHSGEAGESMLVSVSGDTLAELEAELERKIEKYPYWGNLAALIFGRELSAWEKSDLALSLYRDPRVGPGIILLTAEGRAADILGAGFGEATYVSLGLAQAFARREHQEKIELPTVAVFLEALLEEVDRDGHAAYEQAAAGLPLVGVSAEGKIYLEGAHV